MSSSAFFLILLSVILHATWNLICKSRKPHLSFFLLYSFAILVTVFPLFCCSGLKIREMPPELFFCILGGACFGALGNVGLAYAYRHADISMAYPMARALPVLLTAVVTGILGIGKELHPATVAGMAVICTGCFLMPLPGWKTIRLSAYWNKGMLGILLVATAATGYTIVDSMGIRTITAFAGEKAGRLACAGTYSFLRETTVFAIMVLMIFLNPKERVSMTRGLVLSVQPYLAGVFAGIAYVLVLVSMGLVTNVSYVQAFRQLSLPVGMLLGVIVLKEKATQQKIIAITLILGGLLAVSLG